MKVQRIQNNNTSFNARLNINNKSNYGITKNVIADLDKIAKKIGTNKDTITIEIGKIQSFLDSCGMPFRSQKITAKSNINGSKDIKDISYKTILDIYPGELAAESIFYYLYELLDSKK